MPSFALIYGDESGLETLFWTRGLLRQPWFTNETFRGQPVAEVRLNSLLMIRLPAT